MNDIEGPGYEALPGEMDGAAAWSRFTEQLDRLAALARSRNVCGHVFLHTRLEELGLFHPYRDVYRRVEAAAVERGLTVTGSRSYFSGRDAPELWVALDDSHPNAEAHAILAQALIDGLRALPAHCFGAARGYADTPRRPD